MNYRQKNEARTVKIYLLVLFLAIVILSPPTEAAIYDIQKNTLLSKSPGYLEWVGESGGNLFCVPDTTYDQCHQISSFPAFDPMDYPYDDEPLLYNSLELKGRCVCVSYCSFNSNWCTRVDCQGLRQRVERHKDGIHPFWYSNWYTSDSIVYSRLDDGSSCWGWPADRIGDYFYWWAYWSGQNPADGEPIGYKTYYEADISGRSSDSSYVPTDTWQHDLWNPFCINCAKIKDESRLVPDAQEAAHSCTPAIFEVLLDYMDVPVYNTWSEWDLIFDGHFCGAADGLEDWCEGGTSNSELLEALSYYTDCYATSMGWESDYSIQMELNKGKMVLASICWATGGCHSIILTGYEYEDSGLYWYYFDPWYGHQKVDDAWWDNHQNNVNYIYCSDADIGLYDSESSRLAMAEPLQIYHGLSYSIGLGDSTYYPLADNNQCSWDWNNDGIWDLTEQDCDSKYQINTNQPTGVITVKAELCGLNGCDDDYIEYRVVCVPVDEYCNQNSQCCSGQCTDNTCVTFSGCSFRDGSSWDCECDTDTECRSGYYCHQVSGPDACEEVTNNDQCSNHNAYFCEGSDVKNCAYNGNFWEKQHVESCSGMNEYCDPYDVGSTHRCSTYPVRLTVWIDHAESDVDVNKQPTDKFKLNVYSEQPTSVSISYDTNAFEGNCPVGTISLLSGLNSCDFEVKPTASYGKKEIQIKDTSAVVNIVERPGLIILTDSEKLHDEFSSEKNGVKAVLKQAYANAEDDGVVYDLSWYHEELGVYNPFPSFALYNEKITKPSVLDNSYSLAVSGFVKDRCNDCKDVMILGDDYVVPGYRNDISIESGILWWKEKQIRNIYSDNLYIQGTTVPFSDFDELFMDENGAEKKIAFAIEQGLSPAMVSAVENLRATLQDKYSLTVSDLDVQDLSCNSFSELRKKTIFFIGDLNDNQLINCYPFVDNIETTEGIRIESNIWDIEYHTVLVDTTDPAVINSFNQLIESEDYKIIQKNGIYYIKTGIDICELAGLIPVIDVVGDVCSVVGDCVFDRSWGWCGTSVVMVYAPFASSKHAKIADKIIGFGIKGVNMLSRHGIRAIELYVKLEKRFDEATMKKIFSQLDDFDRAPKTIDEKQIGIWTTKQATKIGKIIDQLEQGKEIVVYKAVKKDHAQAVLDGGFDNIGWINAESLNDRFGKNIYSSLDMDTAMKEVLSNPNNIGKKFVIFKGTFKPRGSLDETYKVVPSARDSSGINIVDKSWDIANPGTADTKVIKEFGTDINNYPVWPAGG